MATLHRDGTGSPESHVVLAKGAVERMLDLCGAQLNTDGTLSPLTAPRCCARPTSWPVEDFESWQRGCVLPAVTKAQLRASGSAGSRPAWC